MNKELTESLRELLLAIKELILLPLTHPKGVLFTTSPFWIYYLLIKIQG